MEAVAVAPITDLTRSSPRAQMNSLVHCLPTEILEIIFTFVARDSHRIHYPAPTAPLYLGVSYVCSLWRNAALNCPALWSYIFLVSPRWTEESLERSKQAPLRLIVQLEESHGSSPVLHSVGKASEHVERIQELNLSLHVDHLHEVLSQLSSHAPHLRNLQASVPYPFTGPPFPFHGDTPALRTLELEFCSVPCNSFKLTGLTTLSLSRIPQDWRQSVEELLDRLGCMQNLAYLYLENALTSATDFLSGPAFHTMQRIDLPYLSRLLINAPISAVIAFLSCVGVPLRTEVKLRCWLEPDISGRSSQLFSLLAQRFEDQELIGWTIRSLGVDTLMPESGVVFTFSASERHWIPPYFRPHRDWDCSIPLQVAFSVDPFMQTTFDRKSVPYHVFVSACPSAHVESLHIFHPLASHDFWLYALQRLGSLRWLTLSSGEVPDLDTFLSSPSTDAHHDANQGPNQALVPALEELALYDIRCLSPPGGDYERVQALINALAARKGSRVQLTMIGCHVPSSESFFTKDLIGRWEGDHFRVDERKLEGEYTYYHPV